MRWESVFPNINKFLILRGVKEASKNLKDYYAL